MPKLKIGILTLPLHNNYGGLLQCYALMKILKKMGHDPILINRLSYHLNRAWYVKMFSILQHFLLCIKNRKFYHRISTKDNAVIACNTRPFIDKFIQPLSPSLYSNNQLKEYVQNNDFNAFIVGSDQCWRPLYTPCITNYFFDFVKDSKKIYKRIAYAVSFGVDNWEYNRIETNKCSNLIKKFNAVSVRELSAVGLCGKYFGIKAEHVLDPTMLLDSSDYKYIVDLEKETESEGNLFYYLLDKTSQKTELVSIVADKMSLTPFTVMPKYDITPKNVKTHLEGCIFPRVTQWLRAFIDAKLVVTDSFHGCVFSIIFNKPFWVIVNQDRGAARFKSLLSILGLEDRLIDLENIDNISWNDSINWNEINQKRERLKIDSIKFLQLHLK